MATKIKFNRCYRLTIENTPTLKTFSSGNLLPIGIQGAIQFNTETYESAGTALQLSTGLINGDGLTAEFTIERNAMAQANSMSLKLINLSEDTRRGLVQDRFNMMDGATGKRYRKIILEAGYDKNLTTVFVGNIVEAYSDREGTEIITQIQAYDGLYGQANSFSAKTLNIGTTKSEGLLSMISDMVNIKPGVVSDVEGALERGAIYDGNTFLLIRDNFRTQVSVNLGSATTVERDIFIDNETIHVLNKNDYIDIGSTYLIDGDSGLIGTPIRRETFLECEILFEPSLVVGQLVEIKSTVNKYFDGTYKVMGIRHNVIISNAVNGPASTHLQLYVGTQLLNGLKGI